MSVAEPAEPCPTVAEGSALVPPRRDWRYGIAPHYIGLFLWAVFADHLGRTTLPIGGLGFSLLGALIAGVLCYEFLFKGPALWGKQADRTTLELADRVFGTFGARIVGGVIGLAQVVWFAIGIAYAADWTLHALISFGFLDTNILRPVSIGPWTLPSKLFLVTTLFWSFATALTATWLVRVIGALMNAYPLFPALGLGAVMLLLLPQISRFSPTGIDPTSGQPVPVTQGSLLAIVRMIQLIFGFFAMAGVMSSDWGKGSFTTSDVKVGGWIGVAAAPAIIAALALMTLAAYQGKVAPLVVEMQSAEPNVLRRSTSIITDVRPTEPPPLILRDAIGEGIGGRVGGTVLLLFGLGALAPSVYASFSYAHRFKQAFGGLSRVAWMLVGTAIAWPIIATGSTRNLELIFTLMGAVFAPMAAAFTVIATRDKREWTGSRSGVNPAALGGWLVGLLVGLIPVLPLGKLSDIQPAALWAFLAGYAVTRILAGLGWDPPPAATSTEESSEST